MAELKTKPTDASVEAFLNAIEDERKREDAQTVLALMQDITQSPPKLWGTNIIGFGSTHYTYATGRQGDWFLTGFSPRKQNITLYLAGGFDALDSHLQRLGKYTTGKSCLYIKRLSDVDMNVLRELVQHSVEFAKQ